MTEPRNDGRKVCIIGMLTSLIVAGVKGRKLHGDDQQNFSGESRNPFSLSRAELKGVFGGTIKAMGGKHLPTLAAGVAYYATLALFPMLAAIVAIAALLITPVQQASLIETVQFYLPADVSGVIVSQIESLVSRRSENLFAAIIAIAVAVYGASGASRNLVIASNVTYSVKESRGWLAQQAWGVVWTVAGIAFGFLLVGLLAVNNGTLAFLGLPASFISWLLYGRWVIIFILTVLGLSFFYKFGPNRPYATWQWINWGALLATVAWIIATLAFFVYVQNFANFNQSYSLFAGIIVLMIWMNLSAIIVLLGAEVNHQLEQVGVSIDKR